mmetsp:Transcript_6479/g.18116  ORF Transcript_6479/g.18116 Transcript_6479/m.18116 type:complete len:259 (-) Transcript_6479:1301-2077(-)
MRRLAFVAKRARCASGGSSELALVEADSSLSPELQATAVGDRGAAAELAPSSGSSAPRAHLPPLLFAESPHSTSAALVKSSHASPSGKGNLPFFERPFLPPAGVSAACSSCLRAPQANNRHREALTCACLRTRHLWTSRRSRRNHRNQHRNSLCAASAVRMCVHPPGRGPPGIGSSDDHSTSSSTSGSLSGTTRKPRLSAVSRLAMADPSSYPMPARKSSGRLLKAVTHSDRSSSHSRGPDTLHTPQISSGVSATSVT